MPNLDFDAALAERARERGTDDLTFTLGGTTFTCIPTMPFGVWADFYKAPEVTEDPVGYVDGVVAFLAALTDADGDTIRKAIDASGVDLGGIVRLIDELGGVYNGRPTSPSIGSSPGPEDGTASMEQASPSKSNGGTSSKSKRSAKGSGSSPA